jgi:hypothetical protein
MRRFLSALVILAVAPIAACAKERPPAVREEAARREALAHALAVDAGAASSWGVSSRSEVLFQEGFSIIEHDPPGSFRNPGFRWMGPRGRVRVKSHGDRPMRLRLHGWAHEKEIKARPVISVYVDGRLVADTGAVPEDGLWGIDTVVPAELLRDRAWVDVSIRASAVAYHWAEPPDLRVIVLGGFFWEEA